MQKKVCVNSSDISTVESQEDIDVEINQKINASTLYTLKLDARNGVKNALSSGERKYAGKTMPACGLYLKSVEYID